MYLLDTNVISELRKVGDGKADAAVVAWVSGVDAGEMFISALTLMELEIGILRVERRDARKARGCVHGLRPRSAPNLKIGPSALMAPSRGAAPGCMFPIRNPSEMR